MTKVVAVDHSRLENARGLPSGCLFMGLAVCVFRDAGLFTGGTKGVAFLGH